MSFLWKIGSSAISLFLADKLLEDVVIRVIPGKSIYLGISLTQYWHVLLLLAIALTILSYASKFFLNTIALPLKWLTFGLVSLFVNIFLIWVLDFLFLEFQVINFSSFILTGIIFSFFDFIFK
jgi:uncharacterized membrane protein YvlD (DUF360 family)